jgi:hypothetical protein
MPLLEDTIPTKAVSLSKPPSLSRARELPGVRTAKVGFRPDIEGLRAVAVVAVVLFHADVPGVGGGYVGVDVFFVISGFLITGLLWREVSSVGTVRLRRFYGARARRLLPASATVGVVTAIATALLLPPLQAQIALGDGIASALYISNFWFGLQGIDYLAPYLPESPYLHYWSLSVEEQFYLVWPVLMIGTAWLIRRVRRRTHAQASSSQRPFLVVLAFIAATSFVLSLVATYVLPYFAFFSLPTRAWQLAVGGLLALTASRDRRVGRAGHHPAGLQPFEHEHVLPGDRRTSASARHCAGDRRRLRLCFSRMWPRAVTVTDAGGRPSFVLVVSVALAGPAVRTTTAGPPPWAARQAGSSTRRFRAGGAHTEADRKPAAIRPVRAPVPRSQSRARRCLHRGSRLRLRGVDGVGACPRRPRLASIPAHRHCDQRGQRGATAGVRTGAVRGRGGRWAQRRTVEPRPAAFRRRGRTQYAVRQGVHAEAFPNQTT